ncbi:MAG: hypothetical protein CO065_14840 [Comamonadaceae bacterium CG_4_9_14_0_8_um_filter_57_21]|nr:MAG: hypothetical protein CO065_14840 [Comamonadaceae bacterium CG_4_9_14_0_8_um_filter_57_21]
MNTLNVDSQLSPLEDHLAFLSAAVIRGDAAELVKASAQVQSLAVALSQNLPLWTEHLQSHASDQRRVKAMAARLVSLREGLLRQGVGVERTLAALMPAAQSHTYAPKTGLAGHPLYGSAGRQSGEFKAFTA